MHKTSHHAREMVSSHPGTPASDGAGVKLTRLVGTPALDMVDPFLLLDRFRSDKPGDYLAGFPSHPHRGMETITYVIAGRMRHKDNAGHEGVVSAGGVQWMTAGRGIVHSEMPEQENGLLHGYQLWMNLPAADKMCEPQYQEFGVDALPVGFTEEGHRVVVIAGTAAGVRGPIRQPATTPLFLDISLQAESATPSKNQDRRLTQQVPDTHGTFLYALEGDLRVGDSQRLLPEGSVGVLGPGDHVVVEASEGTARFFLFAGRQINEPVARYGPFVMNTTEELRQAFDDYNNGKF